MARGKHRRGSNPSQRQRAQHLAGELSWINGRYHDQTKRFNALHTKYCRLKQLEYTLTQVCGESIVMARQYSKREWELLRHGSVVTTDDLAMAIATDQLGPAMSQSLTKRLIALGFLRLSVDGDPYTEWVTITLAFPGPKLGGLLPTEGTPK